MGGCFQKTNGRFAHTRPFSFKRSGLSRLSKAAVRKDETDAWKVRFQLLAGSPAPAVGSEKPSKRDI
jgi:hypothetical protein